MAWGFAGIGRGELLLDRPVAEDRDPALKSLMQAWGFAFLSKFSETPKRKTGSDLR